MLAIIVFRNAERTQQRIKTVSYTHLDVYKRQLLQYAIQGKLVEQRDEEGTGEELYQQIQKEKELLNLFYNTFLLSLGRDWNQ